MRSKVNNQSSVCPLSPKNTHQTRGSVVVSVPYCQLENISYKSYQNSYSWDWIINTLSGTGSYKQDQQWLGLLLLENDLGDPGPSLLQHLLPPEQLRQLLRKLLQTQQKRQSTSRSRSQTELVEVAI